MGFCCKSLLKCDAFQKNSLYNSERESRSDFLSKEIVA